MCQGAHNELTEEPQDVYNFRGDTVILTLAYMQEKLFFVALVTNYHKLSALRQHWYIVLEFCRLEVHHRSHWAKIKVLARLHLFLEALRENPFPWLFQLLEAASIPWPMAPFLHPYSKPSVVGWVITS